MFCGVQSLLSSKIIATKPVVMNRAISRREPNALTQTCEILKNTLIGLCCFVVVTGCGVTENIVSRSTSSSTVQSLEVPPDLTTPQQTTDASLFADTIKKLSGEEKAQYQQYQQFQRMAEYEEFLQWRKAQGSDKELNIADFRAAQSVLLKARLIDKEVLVVTGDSGERIVLIADTFDDSWNRIDTAIRNIGLRIIEGNRNSGYFRVFHEVEPQMKNPASFLKRLLRRDDELFYTLWVTAEDDMVTATLFDDDQLPVTSDVGNAVMERLGVQLLTFASKYQLLKERDSDVGALSLQQAADGRFQLMVAGTAQGLWSSVGRALKDAGFTITDKSIETHTFQIRYDAIEEPKKKNLLQRLRLWKKNKDQQAKTAKVRLVTAGRSTVIEALTLEGDPTENNEHILRLLFDRLK